MLRSAAARLRPGPSPWGPRYMGLVEGIVSFAHAGRIFVCGPGGIARGAAQGGLARGARTAECPRGARLRALDRLPAPRTIVDAPAPATALGRAAAGLGARRGHCVGARNARRVARRIRPPRD